MGEAVEGEEDGGTRGVGGEFVPEGLEGGPGELGLLCGGCDVEEGAVLGTWRSSGYSFEILYCSRTGPLVLTMVWRRLKV